MSASKFCAVLMMLVGCVMLHSAHAVADVENTPRRWWYEGTASQYIIQLADGEVKVSRLKANQDAGSLQATKIVPEIESPDRGKIPARLAITHATACKWREQGVIAVFNYRHEGHSGSFWYADSGTGTQHFGLIVHPDPTRHYRCLDVRPVGDSDLVEFIYNEYKDPSQARPERMLFYFNACVGTTQSNGDSGRWHLLTLGKEIEIPDARRFPHVLNDESIEQR